MIFCKRHLWPFHVAEVGAQINQFPLHINHLKSAHILTPVSVDAQAGSCVMEAACDLVLVDASDHATQQSLMHPASATPHATGNGMPASTGSEPHAAGPAPAGKGCAIDSGMGMPAGALALPGGKAAAALRRAVRSLRIPLVTKDQAIQAILKVRAAQRAIPVSGSLRFTLWGHRVRHMCQSAARGPWGLQCPPCLLPSPLFFAMSEADCMD